MRFTIIRDAASYEPAVYAGGTENGRTGFPFSFTKGCRVLKVKGKDKYRVGRFGNLLFDLEKDPGECSPLQDEALEQQMTEKLIKEMEKNECPAEQFERLGLK